MSLSVFNLARLNGTLLSGIIDARIQRRPTFDPAGNDGQLHATTDNVRREAPMAELTTVAVRSLATVLGTGDEVPSVALDGANGLELISALLKTGDVGYQSGAVHTRRRGLNGLALLSRLSWSMGDALTAQLSTYFTAALGTTDPVSALDLIALPTLPVGQERLRLSALTVGGSPILRPVSIDIAINHKVENNDESQCYNLGLPYPVCLTGPGPAGHTEPVITIDALDLATGYANGDVVATFNVVNHLGIGMGANGVVVTATAPIVREIELGGATGREGRRGLEIRPTFNGTTRPLTIATF